VGAARAMEIAAFDEPINADKALSLGLATRVVDTGAALQEACKMANALGECALASFAWSKRLLRRSFETSLEEQLEWERQGIEVCSLTAEGKEGLQAFAQKRKPDFRRARTKASPD